MTQPVDGGRFRSRGRTYGVTLAAVLMLLAGGVIGPVLLGDRPTQDSLGALPSSRGGLTEPGGLPSASAGGDVGEAPGATALPDGTPATGQDPAAVGGDATASTGSVRGSTGGSVVGSQGGGNATGATDPTGAPTAAGRSGPATGSPVTLGIVLTDIGPLASSGFSGTEQYTLDKQRALWQTYIDRANAVGGAAGHKIVPAYATTEFGNAQASSQAACKQLTETDKAIAVVHLLGVYGAPILCFTRDHNVPYLAVDGAVSSFYTASRGNLFTVQPSTLRTHLNSVARLVQSGELGDPGKGTGKHIGLLSEDGYLQADNDVLQRYLEQRGYQVTRGTHSSTSSQNVPAQLSVAATNMCNDGSKVIFLNTNALFGAQFVNQVESRPGCRPAYIMSDFDYQMSGDSFLQQMPDGFYRQAIAVTSSRIGEGRAGVAEPAHDAACRQVAEKATGQRLDRNSTTSFVYFQAQWNCTLVELFQRGMNAAGPTATRASLAAALRNSGSFANGGFGPSSLAGNRTDAPTSVRRVQAFRDCTCWKPLDSFTPATF